MYFSGLSKELTQEKGMKTGIILGASKGLGNAMYHGLQNTGDKFYLISRSKPLGLDVYEGVDTEWIKADLADLKTAEQIAQIIGDKPLDFFIYNAGIWESDAYETVSNQELINIVNVNLTNLLLCCRQLLPNIRKGALKKVILIGSTCGLENEGSSSTAYTATKFATRGFAHALREYVREDGIAVTCISPGSIASDIPYDQGEQAALSTYKGERMPVTDLVKLVETILHLSPAACVKEVVIPALPDDDV